ncbi:hypothetical protein BMS3Abin15_01241 [bacterium BMS3Abin15]|nr:hypothetical protein BMS3Abin15_01241 [bacterium BMS3Abin15]
MHLMQTSGVVLDLHRFLVSNRFICMLLFFMVCIGDVHVIPKNGGRMKKIILTLMSVAVLSLIIACGSGGSGSSNTINSNANVECNTTMNMSSELPCGRDRRASCSS